MEIVDEAALILYRQNHQVGVVVRNADIDDMKTSNIVGELWRLMIDIVRNY